MDRTASGDYDFETRHGKRRRSLRYHRRAGHDWLPGTRVVTSMKN